MATISVNAEFMESLVPMLMGGAIGDRINGIKRATCTMEVGIEARFMLNSMLSSWVMEILALLKERTGYNSVQV